MTSITELPTEQVAEDLIGILDTHASTADREGIFPYESIEALKQSGLLGTLIPSQYGGRNGSIKEFTRVTELLAQGCVSTAALFLFHSQVARRIVDFGTDEQKREILPKMASGEWIGASSWSELTAGSDKMGTKSTAINHDDYLLVDGSKAYCTGAGEADVYTVLVRTGEEQGNELSFLLLYKDEKGIDFGKDWDGMGLRASATKEILCNQMRVPTDRILGGIPGTGKHIMALNRGTAIQPGILSLGICKAAMSILQEQLEIKSNLWTFQNTRMVISDILIRIHSLEQLTYLAAEYADRKDERSTQIAMEAKILGAITGVAVTDAVMQLCGAHGYTRESKIERLYRDARAIGLMGPTTELSREFMVSDWKKRGLPAWKESNLIY